MNDAQAKEILGRIKATYKEKGMEPEALISLLKELRPRAIEIENPLVTKILRMTYEHLAEYGDFLIAYVEPDEVGGVSNFEYMIQLLEDPDNKYNREELQSYRDRLKIYPEVPPPEEEEEEDTEAVAPADA